MTTKTNKTYKYKKTIIYPANNFLSWQYSSTCGESE